MIGENVIRGQRAYCCDDCKNNTEWFSNRDKALAAGWAVGRYSPKGRKCYCPACAPNHRHVGCKGAPPSLPACCKQLKIDNLG